MFAGLPDFLTHINDMTDIRDMLNSAHDQEAWKQQSSMISPIPFIQRRPHLRTFHRELHKSLSFARLNDHLNQRPYSIRVHLQVLDEHAYLLENQIAFAPVLRRVVSSCTAITSWQPEHTVLKF